MPCETIVKGDSKSMSVAAASVLAKVTRDRLMLEYDKKYPEYNFKKHKGYGTSEHTELIRLYGPCEIDPCHSWKTYCEQRIKRGKTANALSRNLCGTRAAP